MPPDSISILPIGSIAGGSSTLGLLRVLRSIQLVVSAPCCDVRHPACSNGSCLRESKVTSRHCWHAGQCRCNACNDTSAALRSPTAAAQRQGSHVGNLWWRLLYNISVGRRCTATCSPAAACGSIWDSITGVNVSRLCVAQRWPAAASSSSSFGTSGISVGARWPQRAAPSPACRPLQQGPLAGTHSIASTCRCQVLPVVLSPKVHAVISCVRLASTHQVRNSAMT
jgi:hypothetical protein